MPQFFNKKDVSTVKLKQLKSWWRQLRKTESISISNNSSNTTLDWRSLSPDRPPLPFFLNAIDSRSSSLDKSLDIKIPLEIKKIINRSPIEPLCPIIEESEMITETAPSNPTSTIEFNTPTKPPTLNDQFIPPDLIGNEKSCKRKFAKMVLAAYKYQKKESNRMTLLFDVNGNIDMMRLVGPEKVEYHKFVGNSQYVPPELSSQPDFDHTELADVWVLGIFLYRMLVGEYPFHAENDKQLFKKMLHGEFTIPNSISQDAKDLLKRMLAPEISRASLDLIIYHPWLSSYRHLLLEQIQLQPSKPEIIQPKKINHKKQNKNPFLKRALSLFIQGPFPPPKKPYQDLAHLGTK